MRHFRRRFRWAFAILILASVHGATYAGISVIHVDDDAVPGGDGSTWASALTHLADALDVASRDAEVRVAAGTYRPDERAAVPGGSGSRTESFIIDNGIVLRGGYAGLGGANPDDQDPSAWVTVLGGDLIGNDHLGQTADNSYHVLRVSGDAVVEGCLVRGGNADGFADDEHGGGALLVGGSPTIRTVTFVDNAAGSFGGGGGGVAVLAGTPQFTDCSFLDNAEAGLFGSGGGLFVKNDSDVLVTRGLFAGNMTAGFGQGGGAAVSDGTLELDECLIGGNTAPSGGGVYGLNADVTMAGCVIAANTQRGVMILFGAAQITECVFQANAADASGGGLGCDQTALIVRNCDFFGNTAESGGGMHATGDTPVSVRGSRFEQNQATGSGGGAYLASTTPLCGTCTFAGNSAGVLGGGLLTGSGSAADVEACRFIGNVAAQGGGWWAGSSAAVIAAGCRFEGNVATGGPSPGRGGGLFAGGVNAMNCVFQGNWAENGGAVDAGPGSSIVNCSVGFNVASSMGGGIRQQGGVVTNCVAWGNADAGGVGVLAQIRSVSTAPLVTYSCVQGGWPAGGVGNIQADPLFLDGAGGDMRLQTGSPCIDAGDNDALPLAVSLDIDGEPRFVDDPETVDSGDGNPMVDMGAHEFQRDATCLGDVTDDGLVGINDLITVIVDFGCTGSCDGDADGNGIVNTQDLIEVLVGWGLCP